MLLVRVLLPLGLQINLQQTLIILVQVLSKVVLIQHLKVLQQRIIHLKVQQQHITRLKVLPQHIIQLRQL